MLHYTYSTYLEVYKLWSFPLCSFLP